MFNLLRMDLYRMKRSKFLYVCFACLLFTIALCYLMIYLVSTPRGQETALRLGMVVTGDLEEGSALLEGVNLLDMFRQSDMDGGMYSVVFGIAVALLVCGDYQGGAMKNIMALHRQRWTYIGSKLMAAGILNVLYLALSFAFNALMNLLFGNMVSMAQWSSICFYMAWVWLVSMAFAALIIFLSVFSRSTTVAVVASVIAGSGIAVMALYSITNQFGLGGWWEYTIYYNMAYGPSVCSSMADLGPVVIGAVFLLLYSGAAVVSLVKKDI